MQNIWPTILRSIAAVFSYPKAKAFAVNLKSEWTAAVIFESSDFKHDAPLFGETTPAVF
jgi:hypothetical protein